jgi:hypothetical protein
MKYLAVLLLLTGFAISETSNVEVVATHSVTRNDESARAIVDKGLMGSHAVDRQRESYNLDAIINGSHVLLACEDSKGCEAPAIGTYSAESLRISRVIITKRDSHGALVSDVCYEYNAKNGYGGYAGTDIASYTAEANNKETFRIGGGFKSALGLCRLDESLRKKGKATSTDLTADLLKSLSDHP